MAGMANLKKRFLYEQLADIIRENINSGAYPNGALPTEQAFVKETGLSTITVRKAFESLVQEGIVVRRRGKGTFVKAALDGVESTRIKRRTRMICYVSGPGTELQVGNFFNRLMVSVQNTCERCDYNAILSSSNNGALPLPVERRRIDGILLAGVFRPGDIAGIPADLRERNAEYVAKLAASGYPVVTVSNPAEVPSVVRVEPDYEEAIGDILERLRELGHERLSFCGGPVAWPAIGARYSLYREQLADRGLTSAGDVLYEEFAWRMPERICFRLTQLLSSPERPTALVLASGSPAPAFEAARAAGLRIPDDISLVSITDRPPVDSGRFPFDPDELVPPETTSWTMPVEAMGEAAFLQLLRLIDGEPATAQTVRIPLQRYPGQTLGPAKN